MRFGTLLEVMAILAGQGLAWEHSTATDFKKSLQRSEFSLIAFVAPSTSLSRDLEPEWDLVRGSAQDCAVISVDCEAEQHVCRNFDVASFPAIRLYHEGQMKRYRGPRIARDIIVFYNRMRRPSISKLDSQNITSFSSIDDVVFIKQTAAGDNLLDEQYGDMAQRYRDSYSFGVGPLGQSSAVLTCYNNINNEQFSTADLSTAGALPRFVEQCSRPLIPEMTVKHEIEYFMMGKSLVYYFYEQRDERERYVKSILPLARNYKEYLLFTTINAKDYPQMAAPLGIRPGSTNTLSVQSPHNGDVFPYTGRGAITLESIDAFLKDIISGRITRWDGTKETMGGIGVEHDEL